MKLVVILGLRAFRKQLNEALRKVEIAVFSQINMEGIHETEGNNDLTNWFGSQTGSDPSVMFFAFVPEAQAETILGIIKDLNEAMKDTNPFHAFQLTVDKHV